VSQESDRFCLLITVERHAWIIAGWRMQTVIQAVVPRQEVGIGRSGILAL